jgi:UrcA family protein
MNATRIPTRINVCPLLAGLASAWLGLGTAISHAADDEPGYEPQTKVVQYGDLNLASPRAIEQLYTRIVAAAKEVCESGSRSLKSAAHDRSCKEQSIAHAVAAVSRPELTALHAARTRGHIANPTKVVQR